MGITTKPPLSAAAEGLIHQDLSAATFGAKYCV